MELRVFLLLASISTIIASPAEKNTENEELEAAEGRTHYARQEYAPAHSTPNPLYAQQSAYPSPRQGGRVTSYNRRGPSASSAEYGLRFSGGSSKYPGPSDYGQPAPGPGPAAAVIIYGHQQDERGYGIGGGSRYGSGGYGPPNAISAQSQQHSQDPDYDPSKDPVSQYAAYIPVREYGPKKQSENHRTALSIYGYRK